VANTKNAVSVIMGGQAVTNPIYAGLTPGVAGLYQVNVAVPPGITTGDGVPVSLLVANQASNQVMISVR
jgi:uncharacterized protein (TIGR03437 family)